MCGIAGFFDPDNSIKENILSRMTNSLSHRGPDNAGIKIIDSKFGRIGLGHRRLRIIDLTSAGNQPMSFCQKHIIYNGEIYNFKEIKIELEKAGYFFESQSDTEVILKAFDKWGPNCFKKFNGMFAITIYDQAQQTLTLVRDRLGVKPLFWSQQKNGKIFFASEVKSLLEYPHFSKELNLTSIGEFFQLGYVTAPKTMFNDIFKLDPGSYLTINLETGERHCLKFWNGFSGENYEGDQEFQSQKNQLKEHLINSCKIRLRSDVDVGCFLSSGVDSSLVAAISQKLSSKQMKTFTLGFENHDSNETNNAKKIAQHIGTDHFNFLLDAECLHETLYEALECWDEPIGDASIIPSLFLSKKISEHVKVVLSGDGGDELFGGYTKYKHIQKINRLFPDHSVRYFLSQILKQKYTNYLPNKFLRKFRVDSRFQKFHSLLIASTTEESLRLIGTTYSDHDLEQLLGEKYLKSDYESFSLNEVEHENCQDELAKLLVLDSKTYQTENTLVKLDRATMRYGLEAREPMLDCNLLEYSRHLKSEWKIYKGAQKFILREVAYDYIPKELLKPSKIGFVGPLSNWLKNELKFIVMKHLSRENVQKNPYLNEKFVSNLRDNFMAGNDIALNKIWYLLIFQMWWERWID